VSRPDFIIIGAMKCATSTLHDQLATQPGVFLSDPKEPCYFSDDEVFAQGPAWYDALFADAPPGAITGESSTHYTKLPTYPKTVARCVEAASDAKLIYVMRDPIDRLVSQYVHEWTMRRTASPIDQAVDELSILTDYSRYAMQLGPWLAAYGPRRVLPVIFERMTTDPQAELGRVGRFLGLPEPAVWRDDAEEQNVSARRMRRSKLRDALEFAPGLKWVRQNLVPKSWRDRAKGLWTMNDRPTLSDGKRAELQRELDKDMAELSRLLDREVTCATWRSAMTQSDAPTWRESPSNSTHDQSHQTVTTGVVDG